MYNWDGTGRAASREFLLYYNPQNRNWRSFTATPQAGAVDVWGQDANNVIEHVNNTWTCYMTDGEYSIRTDDSAAGFGLLFWTQFNAGACWLTLDRTQRPGRAARSAQPGSSGCRSIWGWRRIGGGASPCGR